MIILALVAIIVIPPDKLPEVARQVARFFNDIRRSTAGVWDDIKKDAMLKPEDLMKPLPPANQQNQNNSRPGPQLTTVMANQSAPAATKPADDYQAHIAPPPVEEASKTETKKDE